MRREIGKVPTKVNKDMVAAGNQNPERNWAAFAKMEAERKASGKPTPTPSKESIEQSKRVIIKQILKDKGHDKDR